MLVLFLANTIAENFLLIIVPAGSLIVTLYLGAGKLKTQRQKQTDDKENRQAQRDSTFINQQADLLKETNDKVEWLEQKSRLLESDVKILRTENLEKDRKIFEQGQQIVGLTAQLGVARERITEVERRNTILEEAYQGQGTIKLQIHSIHEELEALRRSGTRTPS